MTHISGLFQAIKTPEKAGYGDKKLNKTKTIFIHYLPPWFSP
jgi:hypothetical protein